MSKTINLMVSVDSVSRVDRMYVCSKCAYSILLCTVDAPKNTCFVPKRVGIAYSVCTEITKLPKQNETKKQEMKKKKVKVFAVSIFVYAMYGYGTCVCVRLTIK